MAAEAILQIKQAEEQGKALLVSAEETAKQILQQAAQQTNQQKDAILKKAKQDCADVFAKAEHQIEQQIKTLRDENAPKHEALLSPPSSPVQKAVDFIIGKIENAV